MQYIFQKINQLHEMAFVMIQYGSKHLQTLKEPSEILTPTFNSVYQYKPKKT